MEQEISTEEIDEFFKKVNISDWMEEQTRLKAKRIQKYIRNGIHQKSFPNLNSRCYLSQIKDLEFMFTNRSGECWYLNCTIVKITAWARCEGDMCMQGVLSTVN